MNELKKIEVYVFESGEWISDIIPEKEFKQRVASGDVKIMSALAYDALLKNHPNIYFASAEEAAEFAFDEAGLTDKEAWESLNKRSS